MNPSNSSDQDTVDRLAEEFVARHRRGEHPAVSEYTDRFPQHAEAIRDLFPALALIEQVKPNAGDPTGTYTATAAAQGRRLERLGDFRILGEVGRGGMGVVYEAEQESLGRHVALKVLPDHARLDPRQLARFHREARAAAKLHHTNIVPVFGVGEQDGLHYYVMQYIPGQSLDTVLEELRRLRRPRPAPEDDHPTIEGDQRGSERSAPDVTAAAVARSLLSGRFARQEPDGGAVSGGTLEGQSPPSPTETGTDVDPGQAGTAAAPPAPSDRSATVSWPGQADLSSLSRSARGYWHGVARIGRQVAEALAYAHGQRVLHRDIKPSNLLLDAQGNVWVADFGLAKASEGEDLTHTGDVVGTLRYLAPERLRGQSEPRGDIYSLGLTLYELLTLRPAFEASDRERLIQQVTVGEPPRPRQLESGVPRDLETIVLKAMAREPGHRYATATALGEDLQRFLEGRPIRARRVSAAERFWRLCKRNPAVAGLTAAVFILLAAVAVAASVGYVQTKLALNRESVQRAAAVAAEQEMRRQWYAGTINLMQQAWDTGQMGRLHALLAETEAYPDRGFEWSYWQRLCHLEQRTFIGHRAGLLSVAWSPDGQRLATGSVDGTARVWQASGGRELLTLWGHMGYVRSVAWSPDGTRLATASEDATAKVWDTADGRELLILSGHTGPVYSLTWSPDGTRLATASEDGTAKVWDGARGRELLTLKGRTGPPISVDHWSPSGVWSAAWSPSGVWSVAWSPDGARLATGNTDGTGRVWDAAGGRELFTLRGHAGGVYCVSWSPDGQRLATGSWDGTAKEWDAAGGRGLLTLLGPTSGVSSVAWSPDGKQVATASGDGTAKVWDAAGGRELLTLRGHASPVKDEHWSPGPFSSVAWSPDGKQVATASGDGRAKVWDAAGGRELLTLRGHAGGVWSVCWSPDGQRLVTASGDGTARVWQVSGGREMLRLEGHMGYVTSVAWSPDGIRLATGSLDGTAKVWAVDGGRGLLTLKGYTGGVYSVAWSPDGTRLITGRVDGTARVWQASGDRELLTLRGHTGGVWSVSWSPDGQRLATTSGDGTAKVWAADGGRGLLTLKGHTSGVSSVAWSPDATRLATGSRDGTAKVWDNASGRELLTLKGHTSGVWSVSWSPDGRRLATGSVDGTVKVWDAASAEAVQEWAHQDSAVQDLLALNAFGGPHAQGFLRTWLLLLPLPLASGETGAQALDRQQLPDEAQLRPRLGEQVLVGGQPLVWREHRSPEAVVNFNAVLGRVADRSVVYAVCYLESDRARDGLWLQAGGDNQAKVYLNGRQIYQCRLSDRPLLALDTVGPVALKQGINVLLFKVVNDVGVWEGCARLVDDAGRPAQGICVKLIP
jgi:eukaryotic-like serine/threonine-protein kinase